jgi:hypothetical protein
VGIDTTMLGHLVDGYSLGYGIDIADIDGDGSADIIASADDEPVSWWDNIDGLGSNWQCHSISDLMVVGIRSIQAADIDGDGDLDVVGAATSRDDILWWENADGIGMTWIQHEIEVDFDGVRSVRCDDLDGDGDPDILAAAQNASSIRWWENMYGQGNLWIEHSIIEGFDGAISVHSADMDGDGDMDVIGVAHNANDVAWWENLDGQGTSWTEHLIDGEYLEGGPIHSADVDGDGDVDIIGSSFGSNLVTWWENTDGLGTSWVEHTIDNYFGAWSVYASDMDDDGDIDVLGGGVLDDCPLTWWENIDGAGTNWEEHGIDPEIYDPRSVRTADINGDSHLDVVVIYYNPSVIQWWDLNAYSPEASLESSILYTGCDPDWGTLLWSSQTPPNTSVSFQVRASDDYTQMGAWSDTLTAPCSLHGLLADYASYIQYRSIFETANPDTTPTLLDVTVTWDPLGTGDSGGPESYFLSPVTPNPSGPSPSISFGLPEAGFAEISVFDISGRLVQGTSPVEYQAGYHTIQLQELHPGIYFVRMTSGEITATQRFAVVE